MTNPFKQSMSRNRALTNTDFPARLPRNQNRSSPRMTRIARIIFIREIRTTVRRNLLFLRRFFDLGSHGYRGWRNDESALSVKSVPSVVTPTLAAALPRWVIRGLALASLALALLIAMPRISAQPAPAAKAISLFDGATLAGWEGDAKLWRVQDDALTGGSLSETVKQNDFLASTRDFTNFIVRFKIKLTGT